MYTDPHNFWAKYLSGLPEAEQAAGLALVRQVGSGGQGDIMAGLLALHHAGGLAYLEAAQTLAKATDAAAPLQQIPHDLAKQIRAALDLDGLAKAISAGLNKNLVMDTVTAAASATKSAATDLVATHKSIAEIVPNLEANTRAINEAGKSFAKIAESVVAGEKKQLDLIQDLGKDYIRLEFDQRRREWAIAALLSAVIFIPLTLEIRGLLTPTPSPDLVALVSQHGGHLAFTEGSLGLALDIQGGIQTTTQGWQVITFPTAHQK